jgi:exopolysaccharide biosynthesis polyprenyl glycosylphosphotransferase
VHLRAASAGGLLPKGFVSSIEPKRLSRVEDPYLRQRYLPSSKPTGPRRSGPPPRSSAEREAERQPARVQAYHRRLFVELCRPADAVVAVLVFGTVFVLANADAMPYGLNEFLLLRLTLGNLLTLALFGYLWQLLFLLFGLYDESETRSLRSEAHSVAAACTLGSGLSVLPVSWSKSGAYSMYVVLAAWPLTVLATLAMRVIMRALAERAHDRHAERVVIVGSGPLAVDLYDRVLDDPTSAYDILGFVDTNDEISAPSVRDRLLGSLDDLEPLLMNNVVDEVLIALPIKSRYAEIQRAIEDCERAGVQSRYSPELFPARIARARVETPNGHPAVAMKVVRDDARMTVKRASDIVLSAGGLVLLAPVLAAIALAIKLTSPGPVLFGQERYGWRKRRFTMYKFRTMVSDADMLQSMLEERNEAAGPVFKIAHDPRVTAVGRFLRRTSLDELPQLWNVFRGEMSLVGPRPLPTRDVHRFTEAALMRRFSVVPGLTCLWQISGRSDLQFDRWIELDLEYIDRWSLSLDLLILLRTVPAVVKGNGAR